MRSHLLSMLLLVCHLALQICLCSNFNVMIAFLISSLVSLSLFNSSHSSACCISAVFTVAGLVNNSSTYSAQLFVCFSIVVSVFPFLSLIGVLTYLYFPANRLVVLHSSFTFILDAASSACLAKLSVKFL